MGAGVKRRFRAALVRVVRRVLRPYTEQQLKLTASLREELEALRLSVNEEQRTGAQRFGHAEALFEDLIATAEKLRSRIEASDTAMRSEWYAVPYVAGTPFEPFESPVGQVTGYRSPPEPAHPRFWYAGFEDLFRGPPERVTELQRAYLPLVDSHGPVLDVGCGRGEFLALMTVEGIETLGVDSDPGMIERCHAAGLPAVLGDAIEYLEKLPDASLGTIFSAQVIEHLPVSELRRLLELGRSKLRPGGLLIAETVNPHSPPALKTFWLDPTHQHPIFPEAALAMCGLAGFETAYVFAPGHARFEPARFSANTYAFVAGVQERGT